MIMEQEHLADGREQDSDASTPSSAMSDPIETEIMLADPAGNQYIRKTVQAINASAADLIHTSSVATFTFSSVGRLVEPVLQYADPILTSIDDRIDNLVHAIRQIKVGNQNEGALVSETHFWTGLKQTFMSSAWFSKVESILSSSAAENFYNTAIECYFDHETETCDQFLLALKLRLDSTWDDRLTQPVKVFYATARTATALVGVGRFFRGAIGLGKSKINTAITQFIDTWERIIGGAAENDDRHVPETVDQSGDGVISGTGGNDPVAISSDENDHRDPDDSIFGLNKKRSGTGSANPALRRVRQRRSICPNLRNQLNQDEWFTQVDAIFQRNIMVQSLGNRTNPAEHLYDTASRLFFTVSEIDAFVDALQTSLGAVWGPDLVDPARHFYQCAAL
uniref:Uncharacterized protein n=1 Tax=Spongospora subterranea TaxID=70186 RepID=A0A0H5R4N9_9EUKA|eukprot:CRZ09108.1 hypothetical protein [Spongospora subterranea]